MAYEDFNVAFGGGIPDEEEDFAVGLPGAGAPDLNAEFIGLSRGIVDAGKRANLVRQQQLERATEMLKQRPVGPTLAERLLSLSAAFAQPSRTRGFAGVLGNVVPVLAEQMGQRRVGEQTRADRLRELQDRYEIEGITGEQGDLQSQLALLKARAAFNKPQRPRLALDLEGRGIVNMDEGTLKPFGANGLPQPKTPAERDALPPGTEYLAPNGQVMRKAGGPTGSAPSGGFPSGNPLDRRSITGR